MPRLLHFGAGRIGRSLVGRIFSGAGWEVLFADIDPVVIEALARRRRYLVRVLGDRPAGAPGDAEIPVAGCLDARDEEAVARAVESADLLGTSVGVGNLPEALRMMLPGLRRRTAPAALLICENLRNSSAVAREALRLAAPDYDPDGRLILVETEVGKMVTIVPADVRRRDPLEIRGDYPNVITAAATAFPAGPPMVPGIEWTRNIRAHVDRKLLVFNFGHAVAACHGFLAGHMFIWECMRDAAVRAETRAAMCESARALARRWPAEFDAAGLEAYVDELLRRFANRELGDTVHRVGRDLRRKLGPEDRFVGAFRMAVETGVDPVHIGRAIVAAFRFAAPDETGAVYPPDAGFLEETARRGLETMLVAHCGLDPARARALAAHA